MTSVSKRETCALSCYTARGCHTLPVQGGAGLSGDRGGFPGLFRDQRHRLPRRLAPASRQEKRREMARQGSLMPVGIASTSSLIRHHANRVTHGSTPARGTFWKRRRPEIKHCRCLQDDFFFFFIKNKVQGQNLIPVFLLILL